MGFQNDRLKNTFPFRHFGRQIQFALDLFVLVTSFLLAYLFRFEFVLDEVIRHQLLAQLPFVVLIQFLALALSGVYTFVWRYVGMAEIWSFGRAAALATIPLLFFRFGLPDGMDIWRVPISVILMDSMMAFASVLALRVARRAIYERDEQSRRKAGVADQPARPALLVGAGRAGLMAAREITSRGDLDIIPVGFIDDDPSKQGQKIHGIKVLGSVADLPALVEKHDVGQIVITMVRAPRDVIRGVVTTCEQLGVKCRIVPGLYEILDGRVEISRLRDVQIEDLLGREPVKLDEQALGHFLSAKRVLVTGAGGSIGSEIARQVARYQPSRLVLVERAEFALFDIDRELSNLWPEMDIQPMVGDVQEEVRMKKIFEDQRPEVVVHAAAHKHVPLMESNPGEAVKNNVLGTRIVGKIAGQMGAEVFVLISTDKAVKPSSVMGATKRLAELVIQDLNREFETRFLAVRFGNVLGSAGSVIPIFKDQISKGGPVTVTSSEANRYFMTIPEASQLVLQAGAMGEGGEIYILDMGEPVRILDLAQDMISLSGLRPHVDIEIVFTGLRPGEKIFEELQLTHEQVEKTGHPKIFIGQIAGAEPKALERAIGRLQECCWDGGGEVHRVLGELVPEASLETPGGGKVVDIRRGAGEGEGLSN